MQNLIDQCVSNFRRRAEDLADGLIHRGVERFDEPITPLTSPFDPIVAPVFDSPISTPIDGTEPWVDPITGPIQVGPIIKTVVDWSNDPRFAGLAKDPQTNSTNTKSYFEAQGILVFHHKCR